METRHFSPTKTMTSSMIPVLRVTESRPLYLQSEIRTMLVSCLTKCILYSVMCHLPNRTDFQTNVSLSAFIGTSGWMVYASAMANSTNDLYTRLDAHTSFISHYVWIKIQDSIMYCHFNKVDRNLSWFLLAIKQRQYTNNLIWMWSQVFLVVILWW